MATYLDLIHRAQAQAEKGSAHVRLVAEATIHSLIAAAPTRPHEKEYAKSLLTLNDIGSLVSGEEDLDAEAPEGLYRIVWNSCNYGITLASKRATP